MKDIWWNPKDFFLSSGLCLFKRFLCLLIRVLSEEVYYENKLPAWKQKDFKTN